MPKVTIRPGHEFEVLSQDELREVLREFESLFAQTKSERLQGSENLLLDANGNGTVVVYVVPAGMEARIDRIVIQADGYTFAALYTNAAGGVELHRDGQVVDGFNLSEGLPNVGTDGASSATRFRNGQRLSVKLVGGPANTNVTVQIEGDLFPRG